jgi:hypothetical protein
MIVLFVMCPMKVLSLTETVEKWGYSVRVRMLAKCGTFGEERVAVTAGATSHF